MYYNRRLVAYFMGAYQAIMGGGARCRSCPFPKGRRNGDKRCASERSGALRTLLRGSARSGGRPPSCSPPAGPSPLPVCRC